MCVRKLPPSLFLPNFSLSSIFSLSLSFCLSFCLSVSLRLSLSLSVSRSIFLYVRISVYVIVSPIYLSVCLFMFLFLFMSLSLYSLSLSLTHTERINLSLSLIVLRLQTQCSPVAASFGAACIFPHPQPMLELRAFSQCLLPWRVFVVGRCLSFGAVEAFGLGRRQDDVTEGYVTETVVRVELSPFLDDARYFSL